MHNGLTVVEVVHTRHQKVSDALHFFQNVLGCGSWTDPVEWPAAHFTFGSDPPRQKKPAWHSAQRGLRAGPWMR